MAGRLLGPGKRTTVVGIAAGVGHFVAADVIKVAELDIQPIANRRMEIHERLFHPEVSAAAEAVWKGCVKVDRIRPGPYLSRVARAPIAFAYRLRQGERNNVQIKTILLRLRPVEGTSGNADNPRLSGAGLPNGRRVDIAAQGRG